MRKCYLCVNRKKIEIRFDLGRIRGLVNFRTEPSSPFSSQKNRFRSHGKRHSNANFNQRANEIEQIMQMDVEHGGVPN